MRAGRVEAAVGKCMQGGRSRSPLSPSAHGHEGAARPWQHAPLSRQGLGHAPQLVTNKTQDVLRAAGHRVRRVEPGNSAARAVTSQVQTEDAPGSPGDGFCLPSEAASHRAPVLALAEQAVQHKGCWGPLRAARARGRGHRGVLSREAAQSCAREGRRRAGRSSRGGSVGSKPSTSAAQDPPA